VKIFQLTISSNREKLIKTNGEMFLFTLESLIKDLLSLVIPDLEQVVASVVFLDSLVNDLNQNRALSHGLMVVASLFDLAQT
jgi:hypothetical protein